MTNQNDRINELTGKLKVLLERQADLSAALEKLQQEITSLSELPGNETKTRATIPDAGTPKPGTPAKALSPHHPPDSTLTTSNTHTPAGAGQYASATNDTKTKSDLEKYIGENLANKIGIAITVIGVAIGTKYSIEHNLISPLTRIILGYLAGAGLLLFGYTLKKKYEGFSAVLVSGAIAILYFITYAASSFYALFPQSLAFFLMLLFTAFSVTTAIYYNRQIIAHLGLVGAYALPFLINEEPGKIVILFTYMSIINAGILVIAFKKYWKPLYYSSFTITWLIYLGWHSLGYDPATDYYSSIIFLFIFFIIFYTIFLAYKLLSKEQYNSTDILLLLTNSFLFYGLGFNRIINYSTNPYAAGLFTTCNAFIHFIASAIIYYQWLVDKKLFYLVTGLVLVFLTIAIPVQLDGNWVTLLWAGEAALLYWIGKSKTAPIYEHLSYMLMLLAFFSIFHDWISAYNRYAFSQKVISFTPLFNITFFSSLLFAGAFGFINYTQNKWPLTDTDIKKHARYPIIPKVAPGIFLLVIYCTFRLEIEIYWLKLYRDSFIHMEIPGPGTRYDDGVRNLNLPLLKTVWVIIYSLCYLAILTVFNIRKTRYETFGLINLGLNALAIMVFLTQGLYALSELRNNYLQQEPSYFPKSNFNITIRYIGYAFNSLLLIVTYTYRRQDFIPTNSKIILGYDSLLHLSILWMISSELVNVMALLHLAQSYKLGLSILWGGYALMLIILGIWKNKIHLRIGAISIFAVTLAKLFFYDITDLDTISKTIVFVSLGILLLVISFLYNKYKTSMVEEK